MARLEFTDMNLRTMPGNRTHRGLSTRTGGPAANRFTLIELLVVIVIVGIVMTLVFPAFERLTVASGVDGATSMIATQLRACRQHAISKRRRVGLVFYRNGYEQAMRPAELNRDESFSAWVENTSWTYLPTGAVVQTLTNCQDVTFAGGAELLEPLVANGSDEDLPTIIYKPTGRLANSDNPTVRVSDATWNGSAYLSRGAGNNWQDVNVNRFTGRVSVSGP